MADSVSGQVLQDRLRRTRESAEHAGMDAVLVTPGSDLRYLIDVDGDSHERLTCLVLSTENDRAWLVVPKLEFPGYIGLPFDEIGVEPVTWTDGESPHELVGRLLGPASGRIGLADAMPALHVLPLRAALPVAEQVLASSVLRELRMRKDSAEIAALAEAAAAIDRVHACMSEWLRVGRTEEEVGADIAAAIVAEGHSHAEFVIVGSGPNSASPHHSVSGRQIEAGDVVVVDIGGPMTSGYNSDSTRTYCLGEPSEEVLRTYAVLKEAQRKAVDAVRPGVTAGMVDAAARDVISDAGLGEHFIHRTGHGIGLDVHEEPYIVGGSTLPLEEGMAFSVEPGIYQAGHWGARIEDIVVVTADGVRSLNNRPHELVQL